MQTSRKFQVFQALTVFQNERNDTFISENWSQIIRNQNGTNQLANEMNSELFRIYSRTIILIATLLLHRTLNTMNVALVVGNENSTSLKFTRKIENL